MEDTTAMTIEFLRARLLSERSVSKSARQRADELAKRVQCFLLFLLVLCAIYLMCLIWKYILFTIGCRTRGAAKDCVSSKKDG